MAPRKQTPQAPEPAERRYFIVNPAGAIHEVDRAHATWRLGQAGWRLATKAEVAELYSARGPLKPGEQRADRPICEPWSPDPDAQIDVDSE